MAMLEFGDPRRPVDLVFLHANGFNALTYRAILQPLAATAHILAVDMRGHGRSTLETDTRGRHSWMDFRDDLLTLLDMFDMADVVLAGHSMGGAVSIFASADAPRRVRRLVLLDPVMIPRSRVAAADTPSPLVAGALKRRAVFPSREAALDTYRVRSAFRTWCDEMLCDYVTDGFVDLPSGEVTLACRPEWESSSFAAQDQDVWGAVARSVCPITILRAEIDSTCRVETGTEALTADGRISIDTIAGAGHFLPMERPALCRDALRVALEA
jgi:pimeloyl-ACP methyl ester carboxylesterase